MRCFLLLSALVALVAAGSLNDELAKMDDTKIIRQLLNETGLDKTIDAGYFTLFAPTDTAIAALPENVAKMLSNATILTAVLEFHATTGIFRSMDASNNMLLKSALPGYDIRVNVYNAATGLFATLNGARIVRGDVACSNGYLHVIDRVMFPPRGSFYDLVSASPDHTVLKQIIDQESLKPALDAVTGTLFAPTDAAFATIFAALKARGMDVGNSQARREFVMYHLAESVVYSAGAAAGSYASMDKGLPLVVSYGANGTAFVNQARVIMADLAATQGVVHVLDSVLVPEPYASALLLG